MQIFLVGILKSTGEKGWIQIKPYHYGMDPDLQFLKKKKLRLSYVENMA